MKNGLASLIDDPVFVIDFGETSNAVTEPEFLQHNNIVPGTFSSGAFDTVKSEIYLAAPLTNLKLEILPLKLPLALFQVPSLGLGDPLLGDKLPLNDTLFSYLPSTYNVKVSSLRTTAI